MIDVENIYKADELDIGITVKDPCIEDNDPHIWVDLHRSLPNKRVVAKQVIA